jgi:hypothetical protein
MVVVNLMFLLIDAKNGIVFTKNMSAESVTDVFALSIAMLLKLQSNQYQPCRVTFSRSYPSTRLCLDRRSFQLISRQRL